MAIRINGIRALLIGLIVLAFLIALVVVVGSIFLIIISVLITLGIITFIVRKIIPKKGLAKKKQPKNYINSEFKVKR